VYMDKTDNDLKHTAMITKKKLHEKTSGSAWWLWPGSWVGDASFIYEPLRVTQHGQYENHLVKHGHPKEMQGVRPSMLLKSGNKPGCVIHMNGGFLVLSHRKSSKPFCSTLS
jgi:hypothetical protein